MSRTYPTSICAGVMRAMKAKAGNRGGGPSVLVLSPTRELAAQTLRVLKLMLPGTALKGSLLAKATAAGTDFSKVDVLVATPLLLVECLTSKKVGSCMSYSSPFSPKACQSREVASIVTMTMSPPMSGQWLAQCCRRLSAELRGPAACR